MVPMMWISVRPVLIFRMSISLTLLACLAIAVLLVRCDWDPFRPVLNACCRSCHSVSLHAVPARSQPVPPCPSHDSPRPDSPLLPFRDLPFLARPCQAPPCPSEPCPAAPAVP